MILYQKSKTPFILRLLPVVFHPGMLLLIGVAIGIGYLAMQEKSSIVIGMYIAIVVMLILILLVYYWMFQRIITKLVLIEVVPAGLHVQQLKYDTLHDVIISAADLDIEVATHRGRKSRRTTHYLNIANKNKPELVFCMQEDADVIGKILAGIDQQKVITLRPKEKEFLADYDHAKTWSKTPAGMVLRYGGIFIFLAFVGYNLYNSRSAIMYIINNFNTLDSPIAGFWVSEVNGLKYEVDFLTDSTFTENIFDQSGRWKYTEADSIKKLPAQLVLFDAEKPLRTFDIQFSGDTLMDLTESNQKFILKRLKDGSQNQMDSLTQFMLSFNTSALLVLPKREASERLTKKFIPESESLRPDQSFLVSDSLFVGTLIDYISSNVVVYDVRSKKRLEFRELYRSEACGASYEMLAREKQPVLVQSIHCEEGGEEKRFFIIDQSGKIISTNGSGLSDSSNPESLLRNLMEPGFEPGGYQATAEGNTLVFTGADEKGNDKSSSGSFEFKGDWLIVTIEDQVDMNGSSRTGIFVKENNKWVSLLSETLIPGQLAAMIDFDDDGKKELIINERVSNSAGANIQFFLYAQPSSRYEKIQSFARSTEGYSIFNYDEKNKMITSEIKYIPSGEGTLIQVTETAQWAIDQNEFGNSKEVFIFVWNGKQLVKSKNP